MTSDNLGGRTWGDFLVDFDEDWQETVPRDAKYVVIGFDGTEVLAYEFARTRGEADYLESQYRWAGIPEDFDPDEAQPSSAPSSLTKANRTEVLDVGTCGGCGDYYLGDPALALDINSSRRGVDGSMEIDGHRVDWHRHETDPAFCVQCALPRLQALAALDDCDDTVEDVLDVDWDIHDRQEDDDGE